ncbi:hypothetical protein BTVI_143352 [Pitangus sulphuratus]|nr:hypothetical protein BTVI_143352 [Pitangus sulphuratus]
MAAGPGPGRDALEVSWVQGFSNKNFGFINNQTVCYPCGNYILFLDLETKKTTALQCETGPVGAFAANASTEVVAFSDQKLNPVIHIHHFPELNKLTELKGSAQLDYTLLAFSFTGPYLASYSSIPEFVLSVWNWQESILLCSESQPGITATSLSFNPINWQQLCFVGESSVTIWHIERIEDGHHLKRNPVELPDEQGSINPHEDLFFPVSRSDDPYHGPNLPVSAIAGLEGDEAETFVSTCRKYRMWCHMFVEKYRKRKDGILLFYHIKDLQYEMKVCADISQPISSLIFSPDYSSLLLATDQCVCESGGFVYRTAGQCYDQSGQFLIARTTEGHVFILDARPSKLFQVLGYIVLADEVLDLSVVSDFKNDLVEVMVLLNVAEVQRARLEIFCLSSAITTDNDKCVNDQGMFNASALKNKQYELDYPLSSAVKLKDNIVYGYCTRAPFICKYHLSEENMLEDQPVFSSEKRIPSNQFGSGFLCVSPNSQWLAAAAKDGVLFIYNTSTMDILAQKHCHSYQGGGIRSMIFSMDGNFILVNDENDGALVCLKWKKIKKTEIEEAAFYWQSLLDILNKSISDENVVLKSMAEWQFDPGSTSKSLAEEKFKEASLKSPGVDVTEDDGNVTNTNDMTWIGQKIQKVIREETQRFANQKEELQTGIKKLRETIQKMMHENEQVPDIEKLEHQEFNLDMEEQERVQAEAEQEVARARKEIEMENLANCYLQDFIKYECWDTMCVKGCAVKCFHMDCEVKNYPLQERSKEELETLEKVLRLKDTETADLKVQKEDPEAEAETEEGEKEAKAVADDGESFCLIGSLSSQYGGDTSILYHQCDLHTKEQRVNQIVLLKDIIYKVKTAFNKEFDVVAQQKEQEIARVKERNLRIREILEQLGLQVEVWEPTLTDDEMPERALTVQDSEIKAEKFLTQEEKEKAEMLAKLEMEKRLAPTDDDRLRALDDMMGGVLEVRKEDILKMEIPPPPFISKPEDLWNDEEKRLFGEYEKKVKELNEEKEEYRQTLKNEWKKLEASIQETTRNFDETVCKLSERKVKSEMVIHQEELKIVNLTCDLLLDEELDTREAGLHNCLTKRKKEKVKKAKTILTAKNKVDAYTATYKDAVDEEKNLERRFPKQFADIPDDLFDELFQLYTRRPKNPRTEILLDTANPYGNCSDSEDYKDVLTLLMKAMDELDSPEHMPEGLDQSTWKKFCLARRNKMESEELVKWKALKLAEMQAFFQRRTDENEKMKSQIENIFKELTWLQEKKMKLQQNLIVQFVLKQGQVELESAEIPDYSDAILIKKSVVEELNSSISTQGEKKIAAIIEFKEFSRGIRRLEWEHKKMRMQIEDLKEKARDIVILPISKDCQLFLTVLNYDSHIAQHIAGMEETLRFMDKLHKKNVKNHQKKIRELKKCIRLKEEANYELSLQLKEMLVSVSERRHIFEAADTRDISEEITRQRYQEILKQKNLRDLIKEQKEEFESLQSELEILRTRRPPHI